MQGSTAARTVFHGRRQPSISIQDYIQRLAKFSKCSPICFVMALIYIDKLQQVGNIAASHHELEELSAAALHA